MTCWDRNLPWGSLWGTQRWFCVDVYVPQRAWIQILAAKASLMMSWLVNNGINLFLNSVVKALSHLCLSQWLMGTGLMLVSATQ